MPATSIRTGEPAHTAFRWGVSISKVLCQGFAAVEQTVLFFHVFCLRRASKTVAGRKFEACGNRQRLFFRVGSMSIM